MTGVQTCALPICQMLSLLLTLLAIPVLYTFFDDISHFVYRLFDWQQTEAAGEQQVPQPAATGANASAASAGE